MKTTHRALSMKVASLFALVSLIKFDIEADRIAEGALIGELFFNFQSHQN